MASSKKASSFSKKSSRQDAKRVRQAKSKSKSKSKPDLASNESQNPPQPKPKTPGNGPHRRKRRIYTEPELSVPKLNGIVPAGVQKPKGKKKGKVFVDDQQSMMTILAMVNADKEGQIESKLIKARQMEEIRQARQREIEARAEAKKSELEETKDSLRRRKRKKQLSTSDVRNDKIEQTQRSKASSKKKVSFV